MRGSFLEKLGTLVRTGVLGLWMLGVVLPMFWVLATSLKSTKEVTRSPFGIPDALAHPGAKTFAVIAENYTKAWVGSGFSAYFWNSLKVVSISLALILLLGSMAAYCLSRFEFRGRNAIYNAFIAGLLIPMQLILIPLFFQYADWSDVLTRSFAPIARMLQLGNLTVSLHNSHEGIILIYVAASLPFTIFTLTSFFGTLPGGVREAAMIDGASEARTFFSVMLPLAKPGLITVAIFNFLGLWNEYLFGIVFLADNKLKTLPLGLASISMQAQYKSDFGLMFAGLVITMVPTLVVYLLLQRHLTKGITAGAVKG